MKMSLTVPGSARGAWLTVGRSAAGAALVAVAVSACTGGGSALTFRPSPQTGQQSSARTSLPAGQASRSSGSPAPTASVTRRAGASVSGSPHASASASASVNPSVTTILPSTPPATASAPVNTAFPTTAPQTGGGGTAGLQDGVLFGIGGAAVLAGLGSFAYRRRLARKLSADQSTRQSPAERESAGQ